MTKVFQIFEEEKQDAVKGEKRKITENLLKEDVNMEIIMKATGLTEEEIKEIEKNMLVS